MGNNNVLCVRFERSYTHCPLSRIKINSLSSITRQNANRRIVLIIITSAANSNGTAPTFCVCAEGWKRKVAKTLENLPFFCSFYFSRSLLFTEANGEKQTF